MASHHCQYQDCDKVYTKKSSLVAHVKGVHKGEINTCCGTVFNNHSNFRRHLKAKHSFIGPRSLPDAVDKACPYCHKVGMRTDNLERHIGTCKSKPGTEVERALPQVGEQATVAATPVAPLVALPDLAQGPFALPLVREQEVPGVAPGLVEEDPFLLNLPFEPTEDVWSIEPGLLALPQGQLLEQPAFAQELPQQYWEDPSLYQQLPPLPQGGQQPQLSMDGWGPFNVAYAASDGNQTTDSSVGSWGGLNMSLPEMPWGLDDPFIRALNGDCDV